MTMTTGDLRREFDRVVRGDGQPTRVTTQPRHRAREKRTKPGTPAKKVRD